jgi:glycerol-3-phosphate dehydrogenase
VRDEFDVPGQRLLGAACWHDAEVRDMPGLLEAMLKRSGGDKGTLLIPGEARDLLEDEHGVAGLRIARPDGKTEDMSSRVVINCAGAWLGRWQQKATCPTSNTLAFNLLLSGRLPGNSALAVSATPGKGRSYFVRPHPEGIFAGTYYRPAIDAAEPEVTEQDVDDFLSELDLALPGWNLRNAQVKRITAGLLPDKDGNGRKLSSADHILVHRPRGFYSILGGKFTTAPLLSRDAIRMIWPGDMPEAAASTLAKTHV